MPGHQVICGLQVLTPIASSLRSTKLEDILQVGRHLKVWAQRVWKKKKESAQGKSNWLVSRMESTVQILPTAITYFSVQVSAKWSKFPRKQEARAPVKSILARHHQESMFSTHQRHIPSPWHIGKSKLDKASLTCIWARISSAGSTIIRSYTINITVLSRSEQGTQKHLHEGTWLFSQPFFPCCDGSAGCSQCWHISMIISSWKSKHFWAPHQNIWWFKKKIIQKYLIVWFTLVVESPIWKSVPWTWTVLVGRMGWAGLSQGNVQAKRRHLSRAQGDGRSPGTKMTSREYCNQQSYHGFQHKLLWG